MNQKYQYNTELKTRSRILRKSQTDAERKLWSKLRRKQILDLKFYRQFSIGNYILDFYCPARKLAIELDGSQHMQQLEYDNNRLKYLQKQEITILRFWDNDVFKNIDGVLEKIYLHVAE